MSSFDGVDCSTGVVGEGVGVGGVAGGKGNHEGCPYTAGGRANGSGASPLLTVRPLGG